jgi:hypothetical protein
MAGVGKETDFDMEVVNTQAGVVGRVLVGKVAVGMVAADMAVEMEAVGMARELELARMVVVGCTVRLSAGH